ncbi:NAD(P)-binding domain-containing protein [Bradyrhizobium sp. ARR65]|uniref:lactate/malate family dehydrogenase n=1 Tax=Bradyrhizobium sp. ARR65 TaxID=1040989 RepID=UPI00046693B7|nr:NAD(P)-binding domain-containing protein [Bradyrhizobium sp. ARR65]
MKVAIIGTGAVGAASLMALVMRGCATEIVLIDKTREKAQGLATDVRYGATLSPSVTVRAGDYADLKGAALVIITAGVNEKAGGATDRSDPAGRLRLLDTNVAVYKDIISQLDAVVPEMLTLVVTDPPDPLADAVRMMGHSRVLSTGTYLDSLRFGFHLAQRFGVSPHSASAQVLGEHGTSEVFVWSSAQVNGVPIQALLSRRPKGDFEEFRREVEQEVKYANISIIEGIGASQHGIGMVCARIAEMILRDERAVIPIGRYHPEHKVTLSLPAVVGRAGVIETLQPELSKGEQDALMRSVDALKAAIGRMKI